jgi:DNA-directed RNA polymerase subunit M/transcription elongation factor TFIIS
VEVTAVGNVDGIRFCDVCGSSVADQERLYQLPDSWKLVCANCLPAGIPVASSLPDRGSLDDPLSESGLFTVEISIGRPPLAEGIPAAGFAPVGNTDAVCPHCNHAMEKMPGRKKKCPHCGEFMYVRTRPGDGLRVLVTKSQAEQIEEQWSIRNGTHEAYLAEKARAASQEAEILEIADPLPGNSSAIQQPTCPYCGTALPGRKPPKRRSTFACPNCGEAINVDPMQFIYPGPYLTDEQAGYVEFVWQLDRWVFTRGSHKDYEQMRGALRKKFGGEPGVGDVIWGLMNQAVLDCSKEHARQVAELRRTFPDDPKTVRELMPDNYELNDVRELMEEFREFERQAKEERRRKKTQ